MSALGRAMQLDAELEKEIQERDLKILDEAREQLAKLDITAATKLDVIILEKQAEQKSR